MGSLAFWKAVVQDKSNFLERVVDLLSTAAVRYCVIGGAGVNAYAEPLITQDLDIVVATDDLERAEQLLGQEFRVRRFEHSVNIYAPDSGLQVQLQLGDRLTEVVERGNPREVLGMTLPVASPEDLLRMKSEAALDPRRRPSKRGKDVLDIARLVSVFPNLMDDVPEALRERVAELVDPESDPR